MIGPGLPSLDQLRVFLTVVETGSFAAAGRRLGKGDVGGKLLGRQLSSSGLG